MRRPVTLLILAFALLSGCAAARFERTPVAAHNDFAIALEQVAGEGSYRHPRSLEVEELRTLLGQLRYRDKAAFGGEQLEAAVFLPSEIDRLAAPLAEALTAADPARRVRFLSFNLEPGLLFSQSRKSEGVLFVDGADRLQIAFNVINAKRLPAETSARQAAFAAGDPLTIGTARTVLVSRPPLLTAVQLADGRSAPLRLSVDLQALRAARSERALQPAEVASPAPAPAPQARGEHSGAAAAPPGPVTPLQQEIRDKLRYLKELLGEGLISEQDYEARKRELLDRL